jgi:hypothetical protein
MLNDEWVEHVRAEYPQVKQIFYRKLPQETLGELHLLGKWGALIVRSSSLLEDNFGTSRRKI